MTKTEDYSLPYPNSWLSPKLEIRQEATVEGRGMFAAQPIVKGEMIAIWGGDVVPTPAFKELPDFQKSQSAQVADGFYLVSSKPGSGDFINHSCNANAGLHGQIVIVAMRDIAIGEEVCIDYAMCDSTEGEDFQCACGAANCRGTITGDDWKLPELQERYAGYFSTYLQDKINLQKS